MSCVLYINLISDIKYYIGHNLFSWTVVVSSMVSSDNITPPIAEFSGTVCLDNSDVRFLGATVGDIYYKGKRYIFMLIASLNQ